MSPSPKREYSRLYHDLVDDPMFAEVHPDDALFGAWAKLLMLGDASWPASAPLPFGFSKARLNKLVSAGLITTAAGRFRVRGLDKERGARSDHGKRGADGRWRPPEHSSSDAGGDDDGMPVHPSGNASASVEHPSGNANGMPSKDEQSKAEQRRAEQEQSTARAPEEANGRLPPGFDDQPEGPALTWLAQHGCHITSPADRRLHELVTLVEQFGSDSVIATFERLAEAGMPKGDTGPYIFRAGDALRAPSRPRLDKTGPKPKGFLPEDVSHVGR